MHGLQPKLVTFTAEVCAEHVTQTRQNYSGCEFSPSQACSGLTPDVITYTAMVYACCTNLMAVMPSLLFTGACKGFHQMRPPTLR